ncbi:MAG TPA: sulfatase, partial [Gemmata sp.]
MHPLDITRRQFFGDTGIRLGGLAMALLAGNRSRAAGADPVAPIHPPLPGFPHHAPKAKAVIYLHLNGGPSQ